MSTIQKAFVFIVLVLAVLAATAQLVLFAQRDNWHDKYTQEQSTAKDLQGKLSDAEKNLAVTRETMKTSVEDLEAQRAQLKGDLDDAKRQLGSTVADKSSLEALVGKATAELDSMSQNLGSLSASNEKLMASKEAVESELVTVKSALQDAEEQYTIASRRAKDLTEQVGMLESEVKKGEADVALLLQKVEILKQYAPDLGPSVTVGSGEKISGRVTGLSDDRSTVFVSVGSDDGVEKGMLLMVYKSDGTYAGDAKVWDVGADKSAALILKPVRATIAEGDNVANK